MSLKGRINLITPWVATIIFLTIGFTTGVWHPTWAVFFLIIIVPVLFCIISYKRFKKYGVDDIVVETVEFYPPNNYSSIDIGYYYKGSATSKDVISLLIYLANKGYLRLEETEENEKVLKGKKPINLEFYTQRKYIS